MFNVDVITYSYHMFGCRFNWSLAVKEVLRFDRCGAIRQLSKRYNTLRPIQNGRYFPDDIFECIFMKESVWIPIKISLKFVPKSPINNIPVLVDIMAWCRPGDRPLSKPILVSLLTHICVTRPQWDNLDLHSRRFETYCGDNMTIVLRMIF